MLKLDNLEYKREYELEKIREQARIDAKTEYDKKKQEKNRTGLYVKYGIFAVIFLGLLYYMQKMFETIFG